MKVTVKSLNIRTPKLMTETVQKKQMKKKKKETHFFSTT